MNPKRKPDHTVRSGRVRASIWEHETQSGSEYRVRLSLRVTKNGTKCWVADPCFGTLDLKDVEEVVGAAHDWIGRRFLDRELREGRSLQIL